MSPRVPRDRAWRGGGPRRKIGAPEMSPATTEQLFARLDKLGIQTSTVRHAPVFTVAEAKAVRGQQGGTHIKNLFLRNKKRKMWLVVATEDRAIDLKALAKMIGAGHVSFARPERLMRYLGVEPGAVSPFGLINDTEQSVNVVLDAAIFDGDPIHCHPLDNAMTTALAGADLLTFIESCGHEPRILDLGHDMLVP